MPSRPSRVLADRMRLEAQQEALDAQQEALAARTAALVISDDSSHVASQPSRLFVDREAFQSSRSPLHRQSLADAQAGTTAAIQQGTPLLASAPPVAVHGPARESHPSRTPAQSRPPPVPPLPRQPIRARRKADAFSSIQAQITAAQNVAREPAPSLQRFYRLKSELAVIESNALSLPSTDVSTNQVRANVAHLKEVLVKWRAIVVAPAEAPLVETSKYRSCNAVSISSYPFRTSL